eukprot:1137294-Pelagomonas_calceolata.AAC.1
MLHEHSEYWPPQLALFREGKDVLSAYHARRLGNPRRPVLTSPDLPRIIPWNQFKGLDPIHQAFNGQLDLP